MSFIPVLLAIVIIILAYSIWTRSRNPFGLPQASFNWPVLIDHFILTRFMNSKGPINRCLIEVTSYYRSKLGDIFVMPIFGYQTVVLCGEEEINWIIKHERDGNLKRITTGNLDSLISSQAVDMNSKPIWKKFREVMSPVLMKSNTLNNFVPTMVDTIREHLSKSSVIDSNTLSNLVFDIGWLFVVGKRGKEFTKKVAVNYRTINAAIMALPLNLPGTTLRKGLQAREDIQKIILKIIEMDPTAKTDPNCCFGTIIENYPEQMDSMVLGMLFAATGTTVGALSGLIWSLINNPTILEKLKNEIRGADCDPQSVSDVQKFPYLDKVVHETFRIYGSGSLTRETSVPIAYKNYVFPKGTRFLIIVGNEHFSVSDPKGFNPDREEKYKLEPFGGAPRNCLGKFFALMKIKLVVYHLLKYYDVTPEKEPTASIFQDFQVRLTNARLRHKSIVETK